MEYNVVKSLVKRVVFQFLETYYILNEKVNILKFLKNDQFLSK